MLSDREKQICGRLRRFREISQIPRTKFALTIGVSSERLESYELGRAQIRYDIFSSVQKHFAINPVWLAGGDEFPKLDGFSDERYRDQIKPRELFSSVFDRFIVKFLTVDRMNKWGSQANLKLGDRLHDPKVWKRLKEARTALGVSFENIESAVNQEEKGIKWTAKKLQTAESGHKPLPLRQMAIWIDILKREGVSEQWLLDGDGKMLATGSDDDKGMSTIKGTDLPQAIVSLRRDAEKLVSNIRDIEAQLVRKSH